MVILVVDEVAVMLRTLRRVLENHGHEVVTKQSPEAALRILEQDNRIKLVITDLMMSEMNGVELFKAAQKIERLCDDGGTINRNAAAAGSDEYRFPGDPGEAARHAKAAGHPQSRNTG